MQKGEYTRAIEAKKTFIKHLKSAATIDHQIRRAYLEIVCIQIVDEDWKRIQNTLEQFNEDAGYNSDEYQFANSLREAVEAKDFKQL